MAKKNNVLPRGYRNNNPLNIRKGCNWQGLSENQSDNAFCVFKGMEWGFRAAFIIICKTYFNKRKVTIRQIISSWAPPNENNTSLYVMQVCKASGLKPDMILPRPSALTMGVYCNIVKSMTQIENGYWDPKYISALFEGYQLVFPNKK